MGGRVVPFRRPARGRAPAAGDGLAFVELARVRDQAEALVVKALLEAHGIQVVLRTHVAPSVHPFTVGDQAEVRILVPPASLPVSRQLLARAAPGPSA